MKRALIEENKNECIYIGEKFDVATNKEYKKQDGYAGMFGKAIDRLQITIS
jgi:hypothetical protein